MGSLPDNPILLHRHPRSKKGLLLILGLALFFVFMGIWFIWIAITPGQTTFMRWIGLLFAALLLWLPVSAAAICSVRKWRTGRWTISPEERSQQWSKLAAPRYPAWFKPTMTLIWLSLPALWIAKEIYHPQHGWYRLPSDLWLPVAAFESLDSVSHARSEVRTQAINHFTIPSPSETPAPPRPHRDAVASTASFIACTSSALTFPASRSIAT